MCWSYVHLSGVPPGPETEIKLFLNSFVFGDARKRFEDGQQSGATMTKLLGGKNRFFFCKVDF